MGHQNATVPPLLRQIHLLSTSALPFAGRKQTWPHCGRCLVDFGRISGIVGRGCSLGQTATIIIVQIDASPCKPALQPLPTIPESRPKSTRHRRPVWPGLFSTRKRVESKYSLEIPLCLVCTRARGQGALLAIQANAGGRGSPGRCRGAACSGSRRGCRGL